MNSVLVNPKYYVKNSPEVMGFELTQAHFYLYRYKEMRDVLLKDSEQSVIDGAFAVKDVELTKKQKMGHYVC